jgi:hypothetical protein
LRSETLAPNDQVPDCDTVLLLDGPEDHDVIVVVPALPEATWPPTGARGLCGPGRASRHRDGAACRGAAARIERQPAHRYPSLHIMFSPDGRQATVRPTDPDAQSWATIQLPVRD